MTPLAPFCERHGLVADQRAELQSLVRDVVVMETTDLVMKLSQCRRVCGSLGHRCRVQAELLAKAAERR